MLVTALPQVADQVRMLRNYGQSRKYVHEFLAYNRRLDTIQAAVLRINLRHLDEWTRRRQNCAGIYNRLLEGADVVTPHVSPAGTHVYHLYVIRTRRRDELRAWLQEKGIAAGMHYPVPIHLQPAYRDLGYANGSFPVTEKLAGEILSLPLYPELQERQIEFIAATVREFFAGH